MSRRHTLLLAPELFASEGGIARILRLYLQAACELAAERNAKTSLIVLNDAILDSTDLRRHGNDQLTHWVACNGDKKRFILSSFSIARQADFIICGHVGQLPVAWLARLFNRRLRYVLIAHGIEVWRPFSFLEKLALRGAHQIWCVSDFTRRELLRYCPLPEGRTLVLPNALSPVLAATEIAPPPVAPVILSISRLSKADNYKGIDHLIAAFPAVLAAHPQARLRIIGRGDDLPRLQSLVTQLNLSDSVRFLGYLSDEELRSELRACHTFALPSEKEGFGLVYLEAMTHGKPCIAARSGGAPEVVSADSGLLVPYADIPALTQACITSLSRQWDAAQIRQHADRFSYSHFRAHIASLLPQ